MSEALGDEDAQDLWGAELYHHASLLQSMGSWACITATSLDFVSWRLPQILRTLRWVQHISFGCYHWAGTFTHGVRIDYRCLRDTVGRTSSINSSYASASKVEGRIDYSRLWNTTRNLFPAAIFSIQVPSSMDLEQTLLAIEIRLDWDQAAAFASVL